MHCITVRNHKIKIVRFASCLDSFSSDEHHRSIRTSFIKIGWELWKMKFLSLRDNLYFHCNARDTRLRIAETFGMTQSTSISLTLAVPVHFLYDSIMTPIPGIKKLPCSRECEHADPYDSNLNERYCIFMYNDTRSVYNTSLPTLCMYMTYGQCSRRRKSCLKVVEG